MLADCGAKTYVVARTADKAPPGRTGTLEEVAHAIAERGGEAVVAPCDLRDDDAIDALFEQISRDDGHLEILVNNAVAWDDEPAEGEDAGVPTFMYEPPWKAPLWWWDDNFSVGVRSHWKMTNAAAPLFVAGRRGVVFFTSEMQPAEPGSQELVLDLRGTTVTRMAMLFSLHLRPHLVSSILLYPGFSRTDVIEKSFREGGAYFEGWTEDDFYSKTASLQYAGRAAAMLAADPDLLAKSGTVVTSADAANGYGFTDVGGARPDPI